MRGVIDATLCDEVCQCLATGRWFSPGTPVSFTNKTDHHDIAEVFVESGIKHHNHNPSHTTINSLYKMDKLKSFITGTM
jgi:hypothetical protein